MSKIFTTILVLLLISSVSLFAQRFTRAGNIELGGTISFSSNTAVIAGETADDATTTFSFSPLLGYFFTDNIQLGISPSFSNTSFGDNTNSTFAIFAVPGYFFDLRSNVYPFVRVLVGYNTSTSDNGTTETTFSGLTYGGQGGIYMQVGNSALVNVGVSYIQVTSEPEDYDGDRIGANIFSIDVGVSIFIGR